MRLYIIRHADPDYPNNTITADGEREAEALSKRLEKVGLDKIYSSPMGRAIDTMNYTTERIGTIKPIVQDWMREISDLEMKDSPWGPLVAWNIPGEEILGEEPFPHHSNWHEVSHFKGLQVEEKFNAIKQHSDEFFTKHGYKREQGKYRCIAPSEEKIAVFCHGGFGLTWIAHLLQIPLSLVWTGFWLAPSSVTTILFDERSPEWAVPCCIGLGDTSHLYEAGLEVKPQGIVANYY